MRPTRRASACSLPEHLRGADLLLHECYFGDEHQSLAEENGSLLVRGGHRIGARRSSEENGLIHLSPLAEVLGSSIILASEHQELGMFIPSEGQCIQI